MSSNSRVYVRKLGCSSIYEGGFLSCVTVLEFLSFKLIDKSKTVKFFDSFVAEDAVADSKPRFSVSLTEKESEFYSSVGEWKGEGWVDFLSSLPNKRLSFKGYPKGKGFAGVMKRYGYAGGWASHGASLSHRTAGSTGACQDPGRVSKGKEMAGRMGGKTRSSSVRNLHVVSSFPERGVFAVRGALPGAKGSYLMCIV